MTLNLFWKCWLNLIEILAIKPISDSLNCLKQHLAKFYQSWALKMLIFFCSWALHWWSPLAMGISKWSGSFLTTSTHRKFLNRPDGFSSAVTSSKGRPRCGARPGWWVLISLFDRVLSWMSLWVVRDSFILMVTFWSTRLNILFHLRRPYFELLRLVSVVIWYR